MEDGAKKPRGRGRGASRGRGRGKGRGRGRGRNAKAAAIIESDDEQMQLDDAEDATNKSVDEANSKSPAAGDSVAESPAATAAPSETASPAAADAAVPLATDAPTGTPASAVASPESAAAAVAATAIPEAAAGVALGVVTATLPPAIDMEADISQLEAPTFTTLSRGPPEPMTRLKWDHKVNLIGEKVLNPMIHCCDQCDNVKPILIYGRMLPCKHVFCLKCGREEPCPKQCPRCKEKVLRVEQSGLGTVFMCTNGGSRYGTTGCRRTYLSQRDLLAHINHRHVTAGAPVSGAGKVA